MEAGGATGASGRNRSGVSPAPTDCCSCSCSRARAARMTGARVIVSSPPDLGKGVIEWLDQKTDSWAAAIEFVVESDAGLARALGFGDRIRYAAPDRVPVRIRRAASEAVATTAAEPVLSEGRIELLWYLREQSISWDYHRYGNLGVRAAEERRGAH